MNIEYTIPLINFPESYSNKFIDLQGDVDLTQSIDNAVWFEMQKKLIFNIPDFEKQFVMATGNVGLLPGERRKVSKRMGKTKQPGSAT